MHKVFVSGSINIKSLNQDILSRLDNILAADLEVIVGDANGVDSSIQAYLFEREAMNVVVYCAGNKPRHNIGNWKVEHILTEAKPGTRAYFTAKDVQMAQDCDYGFMVWDTQSTGTLSNALELLKRNKPSLIYVNKQKRFVTLKDANDISDLISVMSEKALKQANAKIRFSTHIERLRHQQASIF